MSGFSKSYKHAFDFWYKWAPLGPDAIGTEWPNGSISASNPVTTGPNSNVLTYGFYNMGTNIQPALTRNPAVISPDMLFTTIAVTGTSPDESALPWGSSAIDFLWNVQSLSSSISQTSNPTNGTKNCDTIISFEYGVKSFNYYNWGLNPGPLGTGERNGYGLAEYPVTSSWTVYESKLNAGQASLQYRARRIQPTTGSDIWFPATLTITGSGYLKPSARILNIPSYAEKPYYPTKNPTSTPLPAGFNPTNLTYTDTSTGSFDGRFYDLTGGCGITREAISASLVEFDDAGTIPFDPSERTAATIALKKRRLFFPTILTGSSSPFTLNFDINPNPIGAEWLGLVNGGQGSDIYFDENGGIYNVKFNLKRDLDNDYFPDSGAEAELLVYIFNVNTEVVAIPNPGSNGWLPPDNNIVRIKNNPVMSFLNPATGFQIETFNINLVQYGVPAQLVFEATGSLTTEDYFGCIIDDVTFCKVGVSTDPLLIKPTTTGGTIEEDRTTEN